MRRQRKEVGFYFVSMILVLVLFFAIQQAGHYLIGTIREDGLLQEEKEDSDPQISFKLEEMQYYTYCLGEYDDITQAQDAVDAMAQKGYRVWVQGQEPYQLYLGCWGEKLMLLPEQIEQLNADAVLQKGVINEGALHCAQSDLFAQENLMPVVAEVDVLIKHSLKMFEQAGYAQYTPEAWDQMIAQLSQEGNACILHINGLDKTAPNGKTEAILQEMEQNLGNYQQALERILERKNDKALFLAQSYLLQLMEEQKQLMDCYGNET